jgi:hypothetical protein
MQLAGHLGLAGRVLETRDPYVGGYIWLNFFRFIKMVGGKRGLFVKVFSL